MTRPQGDVRFDADSRPGRVDERGRQRGGHDSGGFYRGPVGVGRRVVPLCLRHKEGARRVDLAEHVGLCRKREALRRLRSR